MIEEARSALAAAGDAGVAAEAETTFAGLYWLRRDRDGCYAAVERALHLIEGEQPSPSKAQVLAQVGRHAMLGGQQERAIALSREALQLAERVGPDAARARALNTIGCARVDLGDPAARTISHKSLAIAEAANSLEAWQAAGNYASMLFQLGRLAESDEMRRRTIAIGQRFGVVAYVRWERAEEAEMMYRLGRWEETASIVDEWLAEAADSAYYMEGPMRSLRSCLLLARDDVEGAAAEVGLSLALAEEVQDPQVLQPAYAWGALAAVETGSHGDAADLFDTFLTRRAVKGPDGPADLNAAWVARAVGRTEDVEAIFAAQSNASLWIRAALFIIRDDFAAAHRGPGSDRFRVGPRVRESARRRGAGRLRAALGERRISPARACLLPLRRGHPLHPRGRGAPRRCELMPVCSACGQENPEGFKFCGACGAALFEEPVAAREERKVVTVLFADLVGFTSRAEQLDPEDVRALLSPYHARLRAELERYGGTVEKFIGDAVMALFGAPVAHEDDPERAVRAALAIRDWVRDQEEELQLRIAVNTGEALVALGARPEAGEGMASGDVVNTTARMQALRR